MRLAGILSLLIFLALGGLGAWLYVEDDAQNVSKIELPGDGSGGESGKTQALAPVDPALTERGPYGLLPKVAEGRKPWQAYRRPYGRQKDRPKVAIVITGLGLNSEATQRAIGQLPGPVTLGFSAYGDNLAEHLEQARALGHEVLIEVAVEPRDKKHVDPGRWALMSGLDGSDNLDRLHWNMGRAAGYVGILIRSDGPFIRSTDALVPVLLDLQRRGLIFVDARPIAAGAAPDAVDATGTVNARATAWIDRDPTPATIDAQLARAEAVAQASGVALLVGQAYPITIERVRRWTANLERKGFSLTPLTAIANAGAGQ